MFLEEGHICILHPHDEKPHKCEVTNSEVHYQHGNTKVKGDDISVAFVFRVSPHKCKCNIHSNRVVIDDDILEKLLNDKKSDKIKTLYRDELYNSFDKESYHEMLKLHFKTLFQH